MGLQRLYSSEEILREKIYVTGKQDRETRDTAESVTESEDGVFSESGNRSETESGISESSRKSEEDRASASEVIIRQTLIPRKPNGKNR